MYKNKYILKDLNRTLRWAKTTKLYKGKGLRELKDISEITKIPLTTKQDLRENYPYGGLATDMSNVIEVHTSSGTTGVSAVSFLTSRDIYEGNKAISQAWKTFGIDENSKVMFIMSYGLFSGATINTYALQYLGAFVLPAGIQSIQIQIQLMVSYEIDTIVATPGFLLYLADYIKNNNIERSTLKLKRVIAAGEVYSETVRQKIQDKLDVEVFDHYGLCEVNTGLAYECEYHTGLHILDEYVLAEIIDPETKETVPDGDMGELVLTSLKKEASPIIRYRTGDRTRIILGECKCGRRSLRIDRIQGRITDTMFIKGIKIDPYELKDLIIEKLDNKLNTLDIVFEIKNNDIKFIPKVYLSINDEDVLEPLAKEIKDITKIGFRFIIVDVAYFGRQTRNKVKLVKYAK